MIPVDDATQSFVYHPRSVGLYTVSVLFDGLDIPRSPFKVSLVFLEVSLLSVFIVYIELIVAFALILVASCD